MRWLQKPDSRSPQETELDVVEVPDFSPEKWAFKPTGKRVF